MHVDGSRLRVGKAYAGQEGIWPARRYSYIMKGSGQRGDEKNMQLSTAELRESGPILVTQMRNTDAQYQVSASSAIARWIAREYSDAAPYLHAQVPGKRSSDPSAKTTKIS